MRAGATSPWSRMRSAASSSPRKKLARRPSQASVANASTTWKSPIPVPKLDSRPQMPVITPGSTLYRSCTRPSSARFCW